MTDFKYDLKYLPKQKIEKEAQFLWDTYEHITQEKIKPPINLDVLIEKILNLELAIDNFKNEDILGAICIKERTIIINETLQNQAGRFNFTCAHEIGHWVLHKDYILEHAGQLKLGLDFDVSNAEMICRSNSSNEKIEYQANCFAAALLMPAKHILPDLDNLMEKFDIKELSMMSDKEKEIINFLSDRYNTSREATRIRLETLGSYEKAQLKLFA